MLLVMLKQNKKMIIIIIAVAIFSILVGICIGKIGNNTEKNKNTEKGDTSFILNIDGIKYDITDKVKSFEKACVVVDGSVLTEYLGFSSTVDEERNTVNYSKNLDSFTFFVGDKKYIYNDVVLNSREKCEEKEGIYYVNLVSMLVDLELDVSQSENTIYVKGYYKKLGLENSNSTTETPASENNSK